MTVVALDRLGRTMTHVILTKTARIRSVRLPAPYLSTLRGYAISHTPPSRLPRVRAARRIGATTYRVRGSSHATRLESPSLRFHDLRHVGLTMMAEAGTPLKALMYRAGHSTVDAAMVYQHRAEARAAGEAAAFERQMERASSATA